MKFRYVIVVFLVIVNFLGTLYGNEITPFQSRNQSPFIQFFGLPSAQITTILPKQTFRYQVIGKIANNHSWDFSNTSGVYMDGESHLTLFSLHYGLFPAFEIGAQISFIRHAGGIMDRFIYDFHQFFNLPQGRRNETPSNQLDYFYIKDFKNQIMLDKHSMGLRDVQLSAGYQLIKRKNTQGMGLNLYGGIKLPTGDPNKFTGTGHPEYWLQINGDYGSFLFEVPITAYSSFGGLVPGKFPQMSDIQRHFVAFGSVGLGIIPLNWLSLKTQVDCHSPFYQSQFDQLGLFSAQIISGGRIYLQDHISIEIGISEDLLISTATDVVFYLGIRSQIQPGKSKR